MSRRPNVSQALAMKAAAAAAREAEHEEVEAAAAEHDAPSAAISLTQIEMPQPPASIDGDKKGPRPTGRPKGRRTVAARQTVYLDDARHAALARIAEDRGRSIHSLILEGIDYVIGKPTAKRWQLRPPNAANPLQWWFRGVEKA